jgi:hypothetical protein
MNKSDCCNAKALYTLNKQVLGFKCSECNEVCMASIGQEIIQEDTNQDQ